MQLVNETNTSVYYTINCGSNSDCGNIPVDGLVDLPQYDNQTNINISFLAEPNGFNIDVGTTTTGEQVEMTVAWLGEDS